MRKFGGMTRPERFAALKRGASTDQISPLPIPLPLQNAVVDNRRLITVPWVSFFSWILNIGTRTFVTGTHADRIDEKNDPAQYRPGTWFWETDRTVLYQVRIIADEPQWVYVLGTMEAPLASRPTDLGLYDAGFQFAATDTGQLYLWDGAAWIDITTYPLIIYGTHAERLAQDTDEIADGALWVETDRNNVLYQLQAGVWWYIAGTMFGTMIPDQRPVDLGIHEGGFEFRTTDFPARHFLWSQTAWVEVTPERNTAQQALASSVLALSTTMTDIPGLSLTLPRAGVYQISGIIDFDQNDAGATLLGQLVVNGVPNGRLVVYIAQAVRSRATVAQQWLVSTASANVPVKLQANKDSGAGSSLAHQQSTLSAVWISS